MFWVIISPIPRSTRLCLQLVVWCTEEVACWWRQRCWLSLRAVWPSHSEISSFPMAILALGKAGSRREPHVGCRWHWQTWVMWCFAKKSPHKSCRMGRHSVVMKLICLLGHCECDGRTLHKLSQLCLTADWLAPRESDYSWMHSRGSSNWLPCYIKATWLVLEIFNKDRYFLDSPCTKIKLKNYIKVARILSRQPSYKN